MEYIKSYLNSLISNSSLIMIPIVTYFGYLFAYLFEMESAKFYNIPSYLVQVDLFYVIQIAMIIYFMLFMLAILIHQLIYLIYNLVTSLLKLKLNRSKRVNRRIIYMWSLLAATIFMIILLYPGFLARSWGGRNKVFILVQKDNKEYAIVKIYGDSAIALAVATESAP